MDIKSTKDCDSGIGVVVKYPACIMDNDRVRLYGKRLADVHSIAKPTRRVNLRFSFTFWAARIVRGLVGVERITQ